MSSNKDEMEIWLSPDLFIKIDQNGFVNDECFEGMFGSVIKVLQNNGAEYALKLPKFLSDTNAENAYVNQVAETESLNAKLINKDHEKVSNDGLIKTSLPDEPLRNRININVNNNHHKDQNGGIILVSFEKDQNPKFAIVNKDAEGNVFRYPSGAISDDDFESLENSFKELLNNFHSLEDTKSIPIQSNSNKTESEIYKLEVALEPSTLPVTWYAGVPSVLYEWCYGSLQKAISENLLDEWRVEDYYKTFNYVILGIHRIHAENMIHGDVRPANLLKPNKQNKSMFKVADYGSFGSEWNTLGSNREESGWTQVGPSIGGERSTPFYSVERRSGREFEDADTAIVEPTEKGIIIRVGWNDQLKSAASSDLVNTEFELDPDIVPGDRLRVRNYVFQIVSKENTSNAKVYTCEKRVGIIIHDRLVVYSRENIKNPIRLNLSNYVEYQQWSASTDIYSIGTVLLYCLYSSAFGIDSNADKSKKLLLESSFSEMVNVLESPAYFNTIAKELSDVVYQIELHFNSNPNAQVTDILKGEDPLYLKALHATNLILQSVPKANLILEAFDKNLAHFIIFTHYVLSCIHRQSTIKVKDDTRHLPRGYEPFCKSRSDSPSYDGPVKLAYERFSTIRTYLDQPYFSHFIYQEENEKQEKGEDNEKQPKLVEYSPKSDIILRSEHGRMAVALKSIGSTFDDGLENFEKLTSSIFIQLLSQITSINKLIEFRTSLSNLDESLQPIQKFLKEKSDSVQNEEVKSLEPQSSHNTTIKSDEELLM